MQVTVQSRKFGDFIEVVIDDGKTITSLPYTDRISFAAALRELALQVLKDPTAVPSTVEPAPAEALQR